MLVPAISRKTELLDKFLQEIYSDKYFWFRGFYHCPLLPEIEPENNVYQFAIINNSYDVVGYLAYRIDPYTDNVYNFGLYSFNDGDITMGKDVSAELERLIAAHHRVEWSVVGGNKVKKNYDKFCKKHGGRVLELRDYIKDNYGNYHNSYIYEVLNVKQG